MNRTTFLASLLLLAASLASAAGDNDKLKAAVRGAVEDSAARRQQQPPPPRSPQEFKPAVVKAVTDQVAARGANPSSKPRDDYRNGYRNTSAYCEIYADCPFGFPGAPTFEELRYRYRNYTDSELWDICLGRSVAPFAFGSQGACTMLGSPDPSRPVDVPHNLETMGVALDEAKLPCKPRDEKALAVNETLNRKHPRRYCAAE